MMTVYLYGYYSTRSHPVIAQNLGHRKTHVLSTEVNKEAKKEPDLRMYESRREASPMTCIPLASIMRVAWNNNLGLQLWMASGGQAGLVRALDTGEVGKVLREVVEDKYSDESELLASDKSPHSIPLAGQGSALSYMTNNDSAMSEILWRRKLRRMLCSKPQ